jgi:3-hydroxy-D-aspartate aldolase
MLDHTLIGINVSDLPTPALVLDLDALEFNVRKLPQMLAKTGTRYRAHGKGHKCIEIARRQIAAGAVGICCQKLSEAEIFADGGIADILLTNEVVDPRKLAAACVLARRCTLTMVVDSNVGISRLDAAAREAGVQMPVLVEINLGQDRCGVSSAEEVVSLVKAVDGSRGLRFVGFQAYHGKLQHVSGWDARRAAVIASTNRLTSIVAALKEHGFMPPVISGGGTGTFEMDCEIGVINELQPGSYVMMDAQYNAIGGRNGGAFNEFRNALYVVTQVISRNGNRWCIVDAGLKSLGSDAGTSRVSSLDAPFSFAGDEHGTIDLRNCVVGPSIGDRLSIVPGHCDTTINLHDVYVVIQKGVVVDFWKIDARGCIQ